MKIIANTILLLLSFSSIVTYSQLSHPHFISVNVGTNVPISEFKNSSDLASSSVNSGVYYSFEAGAYFSKLVGIGINIGGFSNGVDGSSLRQQIREDLTNSNGDFSVSSENWNNGYIMLGPYLSLGSKKFTVDAKFLAGVINSDRPFIGIMTGGGNGTQIEIEEVSSTSFGINYGLHFRIQLKSKLALRINAEQLIADQDFESITRTIDGIGENIDREAIEQEISALNLGLGLIINL